MFSYDKESAAAVNSIADIILRAYFLLNQPSLLRLAFRFCLSCPPFDSPVNILSNLKTMFTNIYCTASNRISHPEVPPQILEILSVAFRAFYFKLKFPIIDVVKFQVTVYFKMAGLQMLLQVLRFHFGPKDSSLARLFDKVTLLGARPLLTSVLRHFLERSLPPFSAGHHLCTLGKHFCYFPDHVP